MNKSNQTTLAQLARLREESIRANKVYDAARKQWKAQQRAKARAQGLADSCTSDQVSPLLAG